MSGHWSAELRLAKRPFLLDRQFGGWECGPMGSVNLFEMKGVNGS